MQKLARRKIADYAATQLAEGADVQQLSQDIVAYLVETKQTSQLELLIRDIEASLANYGTSVAHITSAHALDGASRDTITNFIKEFEHAKQVVIASESVDPELLGGVHIRSSQRVFDGTVRSTLKQLLTSGRV